MKEEIIISMFNLLSFEQRCNFLADVREQYVLSDSEVRELFCLTEDEFSILLG